MYIIINKGTENYQLSVIFGGLHFIRHFVHSQFHPKELKNHNYFPRNHRVNQVVYIYIYIYILCINKCICMGSIHFYTHKHIYIHF
jgi:hypothetical protein